MIQFLTRYIFVISIVIAPVLVSGQSNQLQSYTLEDGLPQSQVFDMLQDEKGYLWLGTQGGGLSRFNGEEFKVWNEEDGLLSNYIFSLAQRNDSLFIGTRRGLSIKYKQHFHNVEGPKINKIIRLNNKILLATNIGLYQFNKNEGLQKLNLNPNLNTSIINDIVYDGKLYWIASNKGLWKFSELTNDSKILARHSAFNFTAASIHNDVLYTAAVDIGILTIQTKGKSYGNDWIYNTSSINHMTVHYKDELWLATDSQGIVIIHLNTLNQSGTIGKKNGLKVSHIRKTIIDRQSNIWIATSGGGLYKYFENNFIHFDENNGLKGDRVYAVHAVNDEIWASNSEAGLVKIDSTGIFHIPQDDRLAEIKIKTITSDTSGNIWAGTDGKGILFKQRIVKDSIAIDTIRTVPEQQEFEVLTDTVQVTSFKNHLIDSDTGLPSDWIRTLVVQGDTVWAATYSTGILRFQYDLKRKRLRKVKKFGSRNGIKDLQMSHMILAPDNKIWYATQNGHLGYIENDKVNHLGNIINQKTAINSLLIHNDYLYLGTGGRGIYYSDLNKNVAFKKIKGNKELYSNNIYQMVFDDVGNLWVGSEKGVDKIELDSDNTILDIYHFGRNDGFLGIETCLNASINDNRGNLWFGAIYGLTKYHPVTSTKEAIKPQIFFENIEVSYSSIDSINVNAWAKDNHVLKLSPKQTELSFSYKTIDLDHPGDIKYRYKLNNSEWSPWSSESKQNFAGLAYGPHVFSAQSRNFRYKESDPITFHFFIDSPIYKKTWFQWSVLGGIVLLIALITFSSVRRFKKKNQEEKKRLEMQNHLLSLEQKALRLQMNPHFIFNALNGIKAMSTSNPVKMKTTINTFATLLRETLYNSRKDYITLDQEMKTIQHYVEIEKLMSNKPFKYQISLDLDIDPEEILIPPMLIQPFVENAVRHGILKGEGEGLLKIKFRAEDDFLVCSVEDNGPGIFTSQKKKEKTKTDHQSMALTVTRERLESIAGKNTLVMKEIVEDQIIKGTQIEFKIPLLTDY
ncbi:sensor histidine kinase [Aquimarina brevivitae]|uniref:Two component regulator with propeller domain n=1 Tax=Aquimarina brevivitae TaxID=323412 RepID=A0A4Q7PI71_9FLAO|nr:histidine kinase [Aquimarina brevivitae]RZS99668.1 two component regulator with propeller domain [Aquimarina brevivitae]